MNTGYIFFSKDNGFISKAICWFERKFSKHNYIKWFSHTGVGVNKDYVFESNEDNELTLWSHYLNTEKEVFKILLPLQDRRNSVNYIIDNYMGRLYAILQLIGIGVVLLLRQIGIKIKNPFTWHETCTELQWLHLMQYEKIKPLVQDWNKDQVLVSDLRKLCLENTNLFQKVENE